MSRRLRGAAFTTLLAAAFALFPAVAGAQEAGSAVTSFGIGEWIGLVLRLALVIGVIYLAVVGMRWYVRRVNGDRSTSVRALQIIESRTLGPNRALHLVRLGEHALLIGVTPERINALMQVDDPALLQQLTTPIEHAGGTDFASLLANLGVPKGAGDGAAAVMSPVGRMTSVLSRVALPWHASHRHADTEETTPSASRRPWAERLLRALGFVPARRAPRRGPARASARMEPRASVNDVAAVPGSAGELSLRTGAPIAGVSTSMPAAALPEMPRGSLFDRTLEAARAANQPEPASGALMNSASEAPLSAARALRARAGYTAVRATGGATPGTSATNLEREASITRARRAIVAARRIAG